MFNIYLSSYSSHVDRIVTTLVPSSHQLSDVNLIVLVACYGAGFK